MVRSVLCVHDGHIQGSSRPYTQEGHGEEPGVRGDDVYAPFAEDSRNSSARPQLRKGQDPADGT